MKIPGMATGGLPFFPDCSIWGKNDSGPAFWTCAGEPVQWGFRLVYQFIEGLSDRHSLLPTDFMRRGLLKTAVTRPIKNANSVNDDPQDGKPPVAENWGKNVWWASVFSHGRLLRFGGKLCFDRIHEEQWFRRQAP